MIYFFELIDICISIKKSNNIKDKLNYLSNLFINCSIEEIEIFYQIFINKSHNNKFINNNYLIKTIETIYFIDNYYLKYYLENKKNIIDIYLCLIHLDRKKFITYNNKLTLLQFNNFLKKFTNIKGKNSNIKKINYLRLFLLFISDYESQYVIKLLLNQFHIGIGESFFYKFLSKKYNISINDIQNIFSKTNNIIEILELLNNDTQKLNKYTISLFNPIKFMLASVIPKNLEDIFSKSKKWIVEYKFDGIRVQIHKKDNNIKIYSRNLDEITFSMPDAVNSIKEHINEKSIILDAEAVAINYDGKILPFQNILKRSKRKYNINNIINRINIKINIFDILYLNKENLMEKDLEERR